MKKGLLFVLLTFVCIGVSDAAVRDETSLNRQTSTTTQQRSATVQASTNTASRTTAARTATNTTTIPRDTTARSTSDTNVSRTAVARDSIPTSNARSATAQTVSRSAINSRNAVSKTQTSAARSTTVGVMSNALGAGYNNCRDSYFTCMDQFCAKADETYRRCVCSSRLDEIKTKERALNQTAQQLQDFKDLNIDAISKSGSEVKAMLTATDGESGMKQDKSDSAEQLAGISSVLNKTKTESLSTQGKLDIAGDINTIWATTDLAAGADIMNLTGEKLYNTVHAQCIEFAKESCETNSNLSMAVSAYGMYIENDCTTLSNSLSKKTTAAQSAIRETEREMNLARLETYNEHNSTSINDCIAQVRKDITAPSACGTNYVHCLDITGKYLSRDTGEPIYSPTFYQLESQTSLAGDVLKNQTNRMLVAELDRKKESAKRGLDTCRDLADDVWDEFMRQAITEIYQGQQSRIRQVKNECIDVVNTCYDTQSKSLKDFSNVKEQLLMGSRLELSEQMCKEKLDACSNLYGGGDTGLAELVTTMQNITDQKIAQNCREALEDYATDICAVPSSDTIHAYPFACRTYAPGSQTHATMPSCNVVGTINTGLGDILSEFINGITGLENYRCNVDEFAKFTSCDEGYYMTFQGEYDGEPKVANRCTPCQEDEYCPGGILDKQVLVESTACPQEYIGSLYQKMVRYALQTCVRPSQSSETLPSTILADVNVVMDKIKVEMGKELSKECERMGGTWVDYPWSNTSTDKRFEKFYSETSANTQWGYCKETVTNP